MSLVILPPSNIREGIREAYHSRGRNTSLFNEYYASAYSLPGYLQSGEETAESCLYEYFSFLYLENSSLLSEHTYYK